MPSYLTPGVYVEEIPSQSKPIEGVGTSIAAFVGLAPGGPVNTPVPISNWAQFVRVFHDRDNPEKGPFMRDAYLAHAVYGYFHNGGSLCYVVRAYPGDDIPAPRRTIFAEGDRRKPVPALQVESNVDEPVTVEVVEVPPPPGLLTSGNGSGNGGGAPEPPPKRYQLKVTVGDDEPRVYPPPDEAAEGVERAQLTKVLDREAPITLTEQDGDTGGDLIPGAYDVWVARQEADARLNSGQVEGSAEARTGLGGLSAVDEVTMLCVPDAMSPLTDEAARKDLQQKVVAACENTGDRMAILDPPSATTSPNEMREWRADFDSKFATMYYPWIEVMDPLTDRPLKVPPCGHVAGLWARTDSTRGVHKAPANEVVLGANKLAFQVTTDEQGLMNREGINCIRSFPGRGIRVWGARTISSDPEWRYINVRRLFNYISESIMEGTQWAVFEPNDTTLWTQLKISATNFLTRVWRDGALFGTTPDEAFYVKCDAETNPPDLVEAGQVTVEIGIAPVKPAEFVVFRISQFQAGAEAA
jgi:phage tail sheath protein FI